MKEQPKEAAPVLEGATPPKEQWETPSLEVLSILVTQNNGDVAPGDDIFSPSPTGS